MGTQRDFTSFKLQDVTNCDDDQITSALEKDGVITFDKIYSSRELLQLCARLGRTIIHRDSDENGLTQISKRDTVPVTGGYRAFTSSHLTFHTDGSSVPEPAALVILWCYRPALVGGESLLVDGKQLYQELSRLHPSALQELQTPDSAIFAGSQNPLYGSIFSFLPTGEIYIRFRYDNLVYYSACVCSILPIVLDLFSQHQICFTLKQYQGYIIKNGRWLHCRTSFDVDREVYRVLLHTDPDTSIGRRIHFGFRLHS